MTADVIEECEYLTYFTKELLRFDCPVVVNLFQICKENVVIDNIDFLKDTIIQYNISGLHYNKTQWINPEEFIPERFDPLSKFFLTPKGEP